VGQAHGRRLREGPLIASPRPSVVVFDLGGVLIDWDPRHLYRTLFDDPDEMEAFLEEVAFADWNARQDAGRPFAQAIEVLAASHPHRRALIDAFHERWPETLAGEVPGSVAVLRELRATGVRLFALSNWSAETFPVARDRFEFLDWFEGIVISGEIGAVKPNERPFGVLVERYGLEPRRSLFIDDSAANVETASRLGFQALRFSDARTLRAGLVGWGLLPRGRVSALAGRRRSAQRRRSSGSSPG
jgi:2-haloacid dehalogenase